MEHKVIKQLREIAEKTALTMGDELVELNCKKSNDGWHIEAIIYNENGTSLDYCTDFSRKFDEEISNIEISEDSYFIEVASPGLDRPIKTDDDLRRNLGKKVEVKLYRKVNKKKELVGEIMDYSKDDVTIKSDDSEEKIPRDAISLMRQVIEF